MKVLCTFPGKYGDLLWALPSIRALSEHIGYPVDLVVAKPFGSICPLLSWQPYIKYAGALQTWEVEDTAPITPREPPIDYEKNPIYDHVLHLGYLRWPKPDLLRQTWEQLKYAWNAETAEWPFEGDTPDLTPWILPPDDVSLTSYHWPWVHGFTDEHFELKYGLVQLLTEEPVYKRRWGGILPPTAIGSNARWHTEAGTTQNSWEDSAAILYGAGAFLGCNSALHVLAVAMGVPVVMMEPNPMRHNDIFYPLGKASPRVHLVTGVDGLPTWDARHVADVLEATLATVPR